MKTLLLLITLFLGLFLSSCTSEYEERLNQGRNLIERLSLLEKRKLNFSDELIKEEVKRINKELSVLAKLSGNETLFLTQLKNL